jgi:hypothetical protein
MSAQNLPKPEVWEQNLADDKETKYFLPAGDGYEVCSWRAGPAGSGPTEQVHILLSAAPGMKVVLRLKSARALDELVGVLLEYRKEVWPSEGSKS